MKNPLYQRGKQLVVFFLQMRIIYNPFIPLEKGIDLKYLGMAVLYLI